MEDPDNPDTKKFVEENNHLYDNFIDKEMLKKYRDTFSKYVSYPLYSLPSKRNNKYFFTKNDGSEPQGRFYVKDGLSGEIKELFNFNSMSSDGTSSSLIRSVSPDGKYLATTISKHGSDWQDLLVIDLETGQLIEKISWVTFTVISWLDDNSGFYYSRYPDQSTVAIEDQRKGEKAFFHKIRTDIAQDVLLYDPGDKEFDASVSISEDEQWLFVYSTLSTMPENRLFFKKNNFQDELIEIIPELDGNSYRIIGVIDNFAYCLTSWIAPNKKLMKIDLTNPKKEFWFDLIPESTFVLEDAFIANNSLILVYIAEVKHEMHQYTLSGKFEKKIAFHSYGSIPKQYNDLLSISCHKDDDELFFSFNSFFEPITVYRYDFQTNIVSEFFGKTLDADKENYIMKQVYYASKDGARIPMFLLHNKNIKLDGNNRTILFGYGGYTISLYPSYSPRLLSWLDQGGVYAIANLRGGGEYGKKWHFQGILENKQNVFNDFIAAAEWLIDNKYTNSKKLAINGRSNGGLLVGACVTQRPDLFGVAIPEVGVLDMLRFKHFQAGRYWTAEYGDAEKNQDHFNFLIKFSPVHNAEKNSHYPPILVVAAEADDRVVPMHTKKFTAALQHAQKAKNPILMKIETKSGHGFGKSIMQQIDDNSFIFAFIDQIFALTDKI
jgi:prolyl oligopeptidase